MDCDPLTEAAVYLAACAVHAERIERDLDRDEYGDARESLRRLLAAAEAGREHINTHRFPAAAPDAAGG